MEKELYAILRGLEYFKPIIFATFVNIFTDNKNILKQTSTCQRIQRWQLLLSEYNFKIQHISGKKNRDADLISRIYLMYSNEGDSYLTKMELIKKRFCSLLIN
ncbi:Enzymatic polyprotein [Dictyocoela muelleri]|nr:Enzymatic polyprotein [Dictyocoela muelleri]